MSKISSCWKLWPSCWFYTSGWMVYKWWSRSKTRATCPSNLPEKETSSRVLTWHTMPGQPVLDMGYYLGMQTFTALDVCADSTVQLPQHSVVSEKHFWRPEKKLFKAKRTSQVFASKFPVHIISCNIVHCFHWVISMAALSTLTRHTSGHSPSSWCIKGVSFYYTRNASSSACQFVGREHGKNEGEKHRGER